MCCDKSYNMSNVNLRVERELRPEGKTKWESTTFCVRERMLFDNPHTDVYHLCTAPLRYAGTTMQEYIYTNHNTYPSNASANTHGDVNGGGILHHQIQTCRRALAHGRWQCVVDLLELLNGKAKQVHDISKGCQVMFQYKHAAAVVTIKQSLRSLSRKEVKKG
eukprot:scaffold13527_cov202-Amphora_coffeaeformis.AAC.6